MHIYIESKVNTDYDNNNYNDDDDDDDYCINILTHYSC
jgi:hypothetical protein